MQTEASRSNQDEQSKLNLPLEERLADEARLFMSWLDNPAIAGATIAVIDMISGTTELRDKLEDNTKYFRERMSKLGFDIKPGVHPIVAVMLYDEKTAHDMADALLEEGIYVIGFSYPVVPKGLARIRVQISAAHDKKDLDKLLTAFEKVGKSMDII